MYLPYIIVLLPILCYQNMYVLVIRVGERACLAGIMSTYVCMYVCYAMQICLLSMAVTVVMCAYE